MSLGVLRSHSSLHPNLQDRTTLQVNLIAKWRLCLFLEGQRPRRWANRDHRTQARWLGSLDLSPRCSHLLWLCLRDQEPGSQLGQISPVQVAWERRSRYKEVGEEPTLSSMSGRSPWSQMGCFMPLILALRQEDKKYGSSLKNPVLIPLSLGRKEGKREGKRESQLEKEVCQERAWAWYILST